MIEMLLTSFLAIYAQHSILSGEGENPFLNNPFASMIFGGVNHIKLCRENIVCECPPHAPPPALARCCARAARPAGTTAGSSRRSEAGSRGAWLWLLLERRG